MVSNDSVNGSCFPISIFSGYPLKSFSLPFHLCTFVACMCVISMSVRTRHKFTFVQTGSCSLLTPIPFPRAGATSGKTLCSMAQQTEPFCFQTSN